MKNKVLAVIVLLEIINIAIMICDAFLKIEKALLLLVSVCVTSIMYFTAWVYLTFGINESNT